MNVNGNTALDILLVKYQQLLKENILLTTRVLELEDKLKEVDKNGVSVRNESSTI